MKSLFGTKRRQALSKTFLNVFTLLVPISITTEFFAKFSLKLRIAAWILLAFMLGLGWWITPEGESELDKGDS